ncbi:DUF1801 domain-containing protein [Sphingobium sp. 3R8]|uniref:iron chaperone n=1 Tax=Sphingobium sp. 3R8 TaxID=2874921 RepID=UPI001CCA7758|nr:DUF1801 domain-containing protein [Sphingobium sp. 3R8]MBZ9650250.1 DUF1801 domain-containing protein [Sphingobium sp. 3R8]
MAKPETIEAYVDAANPEAQPLLRQLIGVLRSVAPDAEEGIKWGVPTFTAKRILFTVAAHRAHVAFAPTPAAIRAFGERLEALETTMATIKFPIGSVLPIDLVRDIAEFRVRDVRENDARWM